MFRLKQQLQLNNAENMTNLILKKNLLHIRFLTNLVGKCKNKNFLFLYLTYKKFFESEASQKPVTRKTPVRNCCVFIYIYKEIDWKNRQEVEEQTGR